MSVDLIIVGSAGLVAVASLFLRTNIALAMLGLGIGYTLADLTSVTLTSTAVRLGADPANLPLESIVRVGVTVLPSVLILIRFRRFQKGRFFEHLVPAVFYALLATLLVLVALPFSVQRGLRDASYVFSQFEYFRTAIVIGSAVIAIFDIMVHEQKLVKKAKRSKKGES